MKRCFVLLVVLAAQLTFAAPDAKTIAVLEFKAAAKSPKGIKQAALQMQDVFVTELRDKTKLTVLDGGQIKSMAAKNSLTVGASPNKAVVKKIKALGVNYLLTGSVTEYGVTVKGVHKSGLVLNTRLIDTSTGEVVWADELRTNVSVGGFGGGVDDMRSLATLAQQVVSRAQAKLRG